jgi:hypothetical protein
MIIAAAPGGVTSNVLTKFANGDVALSISLTAVTSLLSIISVPFIVINSANFFGVSIHSRYFNDRYCYEDGIGCNSTSYYWDDYQRFS